MEEKILELIEAIRKTYKNKRASDLVFKKLMESTAKAESYEDAYAVAKKAGFMMEDSIMDAWNNFMGDADVYASTIKEVLYKVAPNMDEDILKACEQIQRNKNLADGLGIKPQAAVPSTNELAVIGENMDNKPITSLDGQLTTYAHKVVDLTMMSNIDFSMGLGFTVQISRRYDGVGLRRGTKHAERCEYCIERAGSNYYKTTNEASGSGVFARHEGCGCTIDYRNIKTGTRTASVQNYKGRQ